MGRATSLTVQLNGVTTAFATLRSPENTPPVNANTVSIAAATTPKVQARRLERSVATG
jgi:hypothetical protein